MLDPDLPLSIGEREEWGNPEDPSVYHRLKGYSPYDNTITPPGSSPLMRFLPLLCTPIMKN
jgi:protease II